MMLRLVCPALMLAMALAGAVTLTLAAEDKTPARGRPYQQVSTMKIQMELEGKSITATLDDNATARDFVSLLPLTLTLRDYEATEKISDYPRNCLQKAHLRVVILQLEISHIMRLGEIWPYSIRTSTIRKGLSN
jgi:flagellar basal body-associated protein FliL